jgi:hypothetical protein
MTRRRKRSKKPSAANSTAVRRLEQTVSNLKVPLLEDLIPRDPTSGGAWLLPAPRPSRVPAAEIPDVLIVGPPGLVQTHTLYARAKSGDIEAASVFVGDVFTGRTLDNVVARIGPQRPILVGVTAVEAGSINEIPQAMVDLVAHRTGFSVSDDIIQINRAGHTKASGWVRLANQAIFDGPVEAGSAYWLLDDFVGQGGTFANLVGHIESNGGRVLGLTALTGRDYSAKLALSGRMLAELRVKHGELEEWWREHFGFGFEALTESEARYLLRAEDADVIRSRLAAAAQ